MRNDRFWQWFDSFAVHKLDGWEGMHRSNTFRKMFEYLDTFKGSVHIVETGCIEGIEINNWHGNGCSTVLFEKYAQDHPGTTVTSLELVESKIKAAQKICPNVKFILGDSIPSLAKLAKDTKTPIDLLFLDASHHDWRNETPSQVHHFNELVAAMPLLHPESMVVVDDTKVCVDDYPLTKVFGKGGIVAQYALEVGAVMHFCEYQIGFTKMTNNFPKIWAQVEDIIYEARTCVEQGRRDAADRLYRAVLNTTAPPWDGKTRIARGEAYANFGRTAHKIRNYGKAVDWFRFALEIDPLAAEYRCDLVRSLVALGAMQSAKRECIIASEIEPENPSVWATFGGVESDMRNEEGAIFAYDKQIEAALALDPPDVYALSDAYLNRAVMAIDSKDYALASKLCDKMFDLKVREGDAWHVLAIIEYRLSNHEHALELFDKALASGCRNQPLCHWNRSLPLQSIGRFKEAFEEHAWGEKEQTVTAIYVPQHRFRKHKWHGQKNCKVHIHTEAGHGDNIMMLRYFPLFKELGCSVQYESDSNLASLVQRCFPDVAVYKRAKDYPGALGIPDFDYHIPIGDLPHAFGTDIDNIPWNGSYLKALPDFVANYRDVLNFNDLPGRKIGLCWSSGIRRDMNIWMEKYGRMKSMRFEDLKPLFGAFFNDEETYNAHKFVSLQVGDGRDELDYRVMDVLPQKPNWDDTAAVIANLDLVITVDTGVAHLAGAMGKPTWVVMQNDGASWHFLCERPGASWNERNPWYPSMRVFRQTKGGGWETAIEKVVKALR